MSTEAERILQARGPKRFQANLFPITTDLLLSRVHDHLSQILSTDTGKRFWDIDRERRFVPDNPKGKYFLARANYRVAKLVGIVQLAATAVSYDEIGTSLIVGFQDNMGWSPGAEQIVGQTMTGIRHEVATLAGPRRWLMLDGGWMTVCSFQADHELDQPTSAPSAPSAAQRTEQAELRKRARLTFAPAMPINAVANAIQHLFDSSDRSDWRSKWTWQASALQFTVVWTRDVRRRAEAMPLSLAGEGLLRSSASSPEPTKLDVLYRYTLTIACELRDARTVVVTTMEETIDPDNRFDHAAVCPKSFLDVEAGLVAQLRRDVGAD
jgi:hypothetical protein